MVLGALGPIVVGRSTWVCLAGQHPCSRLFLGAHVSIKTPIFHLVGVILYVGLPNEESSMDKWIILLDLNDIYILIGMLRNLKDLLNIEGVEKGDYFKTFASFSSSPRMPL